MQSPHSSIQLFTLQQRFQKAPKGPLQQEDVNLLMETLFNETRSIQAATKSSHLLVSLSLGPSTGVHTSKKESRDCGIEVGFLYDSILTRLVQCKDLSKHSVVLDLVEELYMFQRNRKTCSDDDGEDKVQHPYSFLVRSGMTFISRSVSTSSTNRNSCNQVLGLLISRTVSASIHFSIPFFTEIMDGIGGMGDGVSPISTNRIDDWNTGCVRISCWASNLLKSSDPESKKYHAELWRLFCGRLKKEIPQIDDPVQRTCLYELRFLVDDVEREEVLYVVSSRIVSLWINDAVFDRESVKVLELYLEKECSCDLVLLRTVILVVSILLLDFVMEVSLQKLLVVAGKMYLKLMAENGSSDSWVKISVLPLISCLAHDGLATIDKQVFGFLELLEPLFHVPIQETKSMEIPGFLNTVSNPFYKSLVQLSAMGAPRQDQSLFAPIKTLFVGFHLFSLHENDHVYLVLDSLTQNPIPQLIRPQDLFTILYTFLYMINKNLVGVDVLLMESIPALSQSNDIFITFSLLQILQTLLQIRPERSLLDIIAFKSMMKLLEYQKRVFPHVKKYIAGWMNSFQSSRGAGRLKSSEGMEREDELEVLVTGFIKKVCIDDPDGFGKEFMPIMISLLRISESHQIGTIRDLSYLATGNLLDALNACIEGEVTSPKTAWKVIFKPYYESMTKDSLSIIPASLCDFFALVAIKTDEESEVDVLFRQEILNIYLAPLLEHDESIVKERAFKALAYFSFDQLIPYLPSPVDLISQLESGQVPESITEFLKRKIEKEVEEMPRPVFKGFAVEVGVKSSAKERFNGGSMKSEDRLQISNMESLSKRMTLSWLSGHRNRSGIASAVIYFPFFEDGNSYRNICALGMRDITTALASPLQILDLYQRWKGYNLAVLNSKFNSLYEELSEAEKSSSMSRFIEDEIGYYLELSKSSTTPSKIAVCYIIATSMLSASLNLYFISSFDLMNRVAVELRSQIVDTGKRISKEVKSAILLCLVEFLDISTRDDEHEELQCLVWKICVEEGNDDFLSGFCSAKIVLQEMKLGDLNRAQGYLNEFMLYFYKESGEWISIGAAYGFSLILKNDSLDIDDFIDMEKLKGIILAAGDSISDGLQNDNVFKAEYGSLILSCGSKYGYTLDEALVLVSNANSGFKDNAFICASCTRIQLLQRDPIEIANDLIEYIEEGSSTSHMVSSFESLQILAGKDFNMDQTSKLPVNYLWKIINLCENVILNGTIPVVVRAAGWCLGNVLSSLYSVCNGISTGVNHTLDPKDYRRLNDEKSYLRASFEGLKLCSDATKALLFERVFCCIKCILPPVNWSEIWTYLDGHVAKISYLEFASGQASEKGARSLVMELKDAVQYLISINSSDLNDFVYSSHGIGKLLELAGLSENRLGVSISSSILQNIVDLAFQKVSAQNDIKNQIEMLKLVKNAITKTQIDSKIVEDVRRVIWIWIMKQKKSILSFDEYKVIHIAIECLYNSQKIEAEIIEFIASSDAALSNGVLACSSSIALLNPSKHLSLFFDEIRNYINLNQTANSVFILNWHIYSLPSMNIDQKLFFLSKILDLFISSTGSDIVNLDLFMYSFIVLPSIYTIGTNSMVQAKTENDWQFFYSQAYISLIELLNGASGKARSHVLVRLKRVQESLVSHATISSTIDYILQLYSQEE